MHKTSIRRQVILVKPKRHGRIAAPRPPAGSSNEKMVGEAAKPSRPLAVPVPQRQARHGWWRWVVRPLLILLGLSLAAVLALFFLARSRANAPYEYEADAVVATPLGTRAAGGSAVVAYPGNQGGEARPSNRAAPTEESFLATFSAPGKASLPNISGDCVVGGANGLSLDACLRRQARE